MVGRLRSFWDDLSSGQKVSFRECIKKSDINKLLPENVPPGHLTLDNQTPPEKVFFYHQKHTLKHLINKRYLDVQGYTPEN